MYSRNLATFLRHLISEGVLKIDQEDEITRETLVTHAGAIVNPRVRDLAQIPAPKGD